MFRRSRVCQRTVAQLAAETSDTIRVVERLLRALIHAEFVSKEPGGPLAPNIYLPPQAQP
jgi:hypothetical protein